MRSTKSKASGLTPLLSALLKMAAFHREHEKFCSTARREQAVGLGFDSR